MTATLETLRLAVAALQAHRMRSLLTMLGIIIGVASVIATVALVEAMGRSVTQQFEGLGSQALTVRARNAYEDHLRGELKRLPFEDVAQLNAHVEMLRDISPLFVAASTDVEAGPRKRFAHVIATTASYQDVHQRYVQHGRFLSPGDDQQARAVAVIGVKLLESLRLPGDGIGSFVKVRDQWFKVIGVMERRGELFGMSQDDFLLVPYRTGQALLGRDQEVDLSLHLSLKPGVDMASAKERVRQVLRHAHRLAPGTPDDFDVDASDQLAKSLKGVSRTISLVMGGVVGVSLLVGGIGIMNIMLVSVTERTREIGISKALGARRRDILLQFLLEALLLGVMGGLLGIALGGALAHLLGLVMPGLPAITMPWWAAGGSGALAAAIGVTFGVVPASKAAALEPVEALRWE
ncbi:ABC transporter permease [Roseateles terrae]|uniref:ABC transport system permease protein n=1 Tax=Roseateles terrae TaxID=431060 RepID=A0ABR6GLA5_9BURK|nr:ABC transporter permease [Roseateles terrae]MBB3192876.1 putative ABC transport system permease protein [Roseateles terrae]OWQ89863.1 hypothetical protein CDN98_05015 [Roseateles terrae]